MKHISRKLLCVTEIRYVLKAQQNRVGGAGMDTQTATLTREGSSLTRTKAPEPEDWKDNPANSVPNWSDDPRAGTDPRLGPSSAWVAGRLLEQRPTSPSFGFHR